MIENFFFGAGEPRLFGAYHKPVGPRRRHAILLCPALGHEYVQCHFAYRALAGCLAEIGFPVLRFDYRGLGNTSGAFEEATLDDWMADSACALEELARLSSAPQLCTAGIRFGGTLSALAAGSCPAVDAVLLWNPILDGPGYLAEISTRQAAFLAALPGGPEPAERGDGLEILGFRLGARLVRQVAQLDGARVGRCLSAKRVLLLQEGTTGIAAAARESLVEYCHGLEARDEPRGEPWLQHPHHVFLPGKSLGEIATWIESLG